MATNDVFLRQDGGDGTNGVRLRIDAADSGGISISSATTDGADVVPLNGWDAVSWNGSNWDSTQTTQISVLVGATSATTDGADISAATIRLDVLISSATTDGADTSSATIGPTAAASSATTDGADIAASILSPIVGLSSNTTDVDDVSAATISLIVSVSSATTDGADISAATVDPQASVIGVSSATIDGADVSAAEIQVISIIIGGHSGANKAKEKNWEKEKKKLEQRRGVLSAAFEDLPPEVKPVVVKAITGKAAPTMNWEPVIADLDRFQAAIMHMAIAKAARQDENDIEDLIEMGVL